MKNPYKILVCKPERKRPLGRLRHKWEDNIRMNPREIRWEGVAWNRLPQYRDKWLASLNTAMDFRIL
jgi:hypothetical protein